MDLKAEIRDDILTIRLNEARLDAVNALSFKDEMRELVAGTAGAVVLDLSPVTFLDSSGLGAIVAAMKAVGSQRQFTLTGVGANVARVLRLTRMDTVMRIIPAEADEAAAAPYAHPHQTAHVQGESL